MVERFQEKEVVEIDIEELRRIKKESPKHLGDIYARKILKKRKEWLQEQRKNDAKEIKLLLNKKHRMFLKKNGICIMCRTREVEEEKNISCCKVCGENKKRYRNNARRKKGTLVYRCDVCNQGQGVVFGFVKEARENKCKHKLRLQRQFENEKGDVWWIDEKKR